MTSRKHASTAFWITVALVAVLVGYPLSFGPACWIVSYVGRGDRDVSRVYQPLMRLWWRGKMPMHGDCLERYARTFAKKDWQVVQVTSTGEYDFGYWSN